MLAAGLAQLLAVAIALPMGFQRHELAMTALFALPWLVAAALFHAARKVDAGGA